MSATDELRVKELWGSMSQERIALDIGRTPRWVSNTAVRLGLKSGPISRRWTEAEEQVLRDRAGRDPIPVIAEALGRPADSTRLKAKAMGLPTSSLRVCRRCSATIISHGNRQFCDTCRQIVKTERNLEANRAYRERRQAQKTELLELRLAASTPEPQPRPGCAPRKRRKPRNGLEAIREDMREAAQKGYGVSYGRYKAAEHDKG